MQGRRCQHCRLPLLMGDPHAFLVMWISQFCFQNQGRFSSHWEEWRSLAALNSSSIWALAIAIINCWLYLRRFWNIKYQAGFSQIGKFVCASLWEYGTVLVLKLWNTTWVGRRGDKKAEVVNWWCERWLSVPQLLEQPLFSLSCFVLQSSFSPVSIRTHYLLFCLCD